MPVAALQKIYQSVIVAKLTYATSAWWGFAYRPDLQRLNSFLNRGVKCDFYPTDTPSFVELCEAADRKLFQSVLYIKNHVLYPLLPTVSFIYEFYSVRPRVHDRLLPKRTFYLVSCNYIELMRHKESY